MRISENEAKVREQIAASGVDGVVVMRLVYDENEVTYNAGTYPGPYYSFWGYYGWAYPIAYQPGYLQTDRLVGIETNVYDVETEKLVWSGLSRTKNPDERGQARGGYREGSAIGDEEVRFPSVVRRAQRRTRQTSSSDNLVCRQKRLRLLLSNATILKGASQRRRARTT